MATAKARTLCEKKRVYYRGDNYRIRVEADGAPYDMDSEIVVFLC